MDNDKEITIGAILKLNEIYGLAVNIDNGKISEVIIDN